jgi:hypothetical protein
MKKIYLIITIVLVSSYSCKAQFNKLSRTEYYNIRINDVTFQSLYDTNADTVMMKALFGSSLEFEANTTGPFLGRDFRNNTVYLSFEDDSDTGNEYYLTNIQIETSLATVNVKGINVKLGDHKSVFGSLLLNLNTNSIIFIDEETGTSSLAFKINPITNKITNIEFNAY